MTDYYLAVDIGASSGRHMLSWYEDGKMHLEEVYRFENGMERIGGHLCWNTEKLFREILSGLKRCKDIGKIPKTMGIDTWAVDYVLLDSEGNLCGRTYGYRDGRTEKIDERVYELISEEELYKRTGIQKQPFNTIYQLMAVKENEPELMERAESLLMIPDYFNYRLTGVKKTEYTNATTTQLVSPKTRTWDMELIGLLGYKKSIFGDITLPGTVVGRLKSEIKEEIGFDIEVLQAATHDTASAVIAVPALNEQFLYISSGTWSLMGVEQKESNCSKEAMNLNLTNEGGYEYRYRFLKNIMGLWMIQSVRHELSDTYSFAELCKMAEAEQFESRVDVNDGSFLAPESMINAVRDYCGRSGQKIPDSVGELASVIYNSLAESYGRTVKEIESLTKQTYESIHIVGGGANAEYLNRLTANAVQKTIYAGPTEATAIGNIAVQMIKDGIFKDLENARKCIFDSFEIKTYRPQ
jgi:rhamnulokinase